jgi:peptidoglycan/xylan/chitin deacetylase (PgdA/CDA1 family)
MTYLKSRGYRCLSLHDVRDYVLYQQPVPDKSVCIVFDDGYANNYTDAFPILQEVDFTATIFIATAYCEKVNQWCEPYHAIPRLSMLAWEQIREMSRYGIEFGSHSQSHPNLTALAIDQVQDEIIGAKSAIEDCIGKEVNFLSYPFGHFNADVKSVARSAFQCAVSNILGKVTRTSDLYALHRINATSGIFKFLPTKLAFSNSLNTYIAVKNVANHCKRLIGS